VKKTSREGRKKKKIRKKKEGKAAETFRGSLKEKKKCRKIKSAGSKRRVRKLT